MNETFKKYFSKANQITELTFISKKYYKDPLSEIELNCIFYDPKGIKRKVPAFWDGNDIWRVRYSSRLEGQHKFKTECSNKMDEGLHDIEGLVEIDQYMGNNSLLLHGRLSISKDQRHLEHVDGNPFLWLGDTWWFALTNRLKWPEDFKYLTNDRINKGFSVIQLVAGFIPESPFFDLGNKNDGGFAWDKDFKSVNPSFFSMADLRINWLIENGLLPCIVGSWGYFLPLIGIEKMKKHWRYLVARWGAYPVIWCVAGEAKMQHYSEYKASVEKNKDLDISRKQKEGWSQIAGYIRSIDCYNNPITVHPSPGDNSFSSRDIFEDDSLFDIDMLQTGHCDKNTFKDHFKTVEESINSKPIKPVVIGEVNYEGSMGGNWQDTQRFLYWTSMLSGCAGYTYGAQGVWNSNGDIEFKGGSGNAGDYPWKEAMNFPGSYQLGLGKKFIEKYDYSKLEVHPEWVEPHWDNSNKILPYCVGIPGKLRIIYFPSYHLLNDTCNFPFIKVKILNIEKTINYKAFYFNPRNGDRVWEEDKVSPNDKGEWIIERRNGPISTNPSFEDWVLVLEAKN